MGSRRSPFDPVAQGLDKDFQLTSYADLKDSGAKVAAVELDKLLQTLKDPDDKKLEEERMVLQPEYGEL